MCPLDVAIAVLLYKQTVYTGADQEATVLLRFVKRIACDVYIFRMCLFWTKVKQRKQSKVIVIFKVLCHDFTGSAHLRIDFPPCGP